MSECNLLFFAPLLVSLVASLAAPQLQVVSASSTSTPLPTLPSPATQPPPTLALLPIRRRPHRGHSKRLNASAPVLNCSKQLEEAGLSRRSLYYLQDAFLDPVLHSCFRAHSYNVRQLPLVVGARREVVEVEYAFELTAILRLGNDGSMEARANIEFGWNDRLRRWNTNQIPINYTLIPAHELWFVCFVSTCKST